MSPMLAEAEKALYQLDKLFEQSERMDTVFRQYLKGIAQSLKVGRVSLMLLDETRQELFIHESEGLNPGVKSKTRIPLGEGIAGWVAKSGESLFVEDIDKNKQFRKEKKEKGFRSPSFICIPIKVRGKVYGVINVSEKKGAAPFRVDDLHKLELFGMHLAILVENQKLRNQIKILEKKPVDEIAEVSHDFRIPLTCVQEVLHLLEGEELGPITDTQREFLELAKRSVTRMLQTFDHLIGIASRITRQPPKLEKTDLRPIVEEISRNFEPKARRRRVHLESEIKGEGDCSVKTDPLKVHEILMNLVDNAVKHTREGTDVILRLLPRSESVRVEIEDHGVGIPEKERATIFDKAVRIQRAREEGSAESHGLGLAISCDMVQMLGGKIGFDTKTGEGSTFYIELPKHDKWRIPANAPRLMLSKESPKKGTSMKGNKG